MKQTKAFTILELVVAMGIIAIILGLGFFGLITLRATIQLQSEYSGFVSSLKVLQNRAINSTSSTTTSFAALNLPTYYAMRIDPTSYQYYNCTGTSTLTCTAITKSKVSLVNKDVSFTTIGCNFIGFQRLTGDIVKIDSSNGTFTTGTSGSNCQITLSPRNNQATKTINIDIYTNKIVLPNN